MKNNFTYNIMQMSYEEMKRAYDEDLRNYGYVKQSTINSFALNQEDKKLTTNKSKKGLVYLKRLHNDIEEYGFIRNDTVNTIIGYTPPKLKKKIKKKVVKQKSKKTKRESLRDSYVYHKIFTKHYGNIKHCMMCGSSDRLQIHHKDKNHKNNDISNLMMLCYKCHCSAHKGDRVYRLMIKKL